MKVLKFIPVVFLFCACNTKQTESAPESANNSERLIVQRDTVYLIRNAEITPANSYSDLFLDSTTVEQFLQAKKLSTDDEKSFRSFYNYRNGQFAWFTSLGFTEQAKGFWNLQDELGSKADKSLRNKMDTLLNADTSSISRFDTSIINTELALTNAYVQFYKNNRDKTQFALTSPEKAIPVKKQNTLVLADSIL